MLPLLQRDASASAGRRGSQPPGATLIPPQDQDVRASVLEWLVSPQTTRISVFLQGQLFEVPTQSLRRLPGSSLLKGFPSQMLVLGPTEVLLRFLTASSPGCCFGPKCHTSITFRPQSGDCPPPVSSPATRHLEDFLHLFKLTSKLRTKPLSETGAPRVHVLKLLSSQTFFSSAVVTAGFLFTFYFLHRRAKQKHSRTLR